MKKRSLQYLTIIQFTYLVYFLLTTILFAMAMKQGNEGVTFKLFGGGDDGYFYWVQAQNVANGAMWTRTSIYPLILGTLMKITGIKSVYFIRMFNYFGFILLVLSSLILINVQYIGDESEIDKNYAYKSKILLLISYLFYASLQMNINFSILRDIWIYLIYIVSIILSVKMMNNRKRKLYYLVILVLSLWLLGEFRKYALLAFVLSLSIYLIYSKAKLFKNFKAFVFLGIIAFFIYYTFFIDFNIANMSLRRALNYRMSGLTSYSGGSNMWISLEQPNVILFLINYIHSYVGNLIGPLPWHISGISTLFVFVVETIPMVFILKFLWKRRSLLSKVQKYILLHAFVWVSLIAVTNDNIGTASRLRPVAWLLILNVFVVVYMKYKNLKYMKNSD